MGDREQWKSHLGFYGYPPEIEEELRGRRRRRARRHHRVAQRQETRAYIAERRRQEPVTAGGAIVIVLVLIGLAAAGRWLMGSPASGAHHRAVVTVSAGPSPDVSATTVTPGPSVSPTPSADLSSATTVAEEFARHYLTRNPPVDGDHAASVERAAPWMTQALAANLANSPDADFDQLVSRGGVARVTHVKVAPAGSKLPPTARCGCGVP